MILWTIKLLKEVRRAIAGRRFPAQLAWAVSFGILLGILPHGNLLALGLLLVVLSLKLNHAMAGLTAICTSFLATWLDPFSHQLGEYVLTHPRVSGAATAAWQWPLIPWTDLNNTVVMGSLLIGAAAMLPTFFITYPIFRVLAPRDRAEPVPEPTPPESGSGRLDRDRPQRDRIVNADHRQLAGPHHAAAAAAAQQRAGTEDSGTEDSSTDAPVTVETRIDVIRLQDYRSADPEDVPQVPPAHPPLEGDRREPADEDSGSMDGALRYLLGQLRDSQQRKAA